MSKRIGRVSLLTICGALLAVSLGSVPKARCENCPEAHLSEGNYIKCLAGQNAQCESGPKCSCTGRANKDNECGGGCGVYTNWGACTVQCKKGMNATCIQGSKKWIGLQQILIKPVCRCGGGGSVSSILSAKFDDRSLIALSGESLFSERRLKVLGPLTLAE